MHNCILLLCVCARWRSVPTWEQFHWPSFRKWFGRQLARSYLRSVRRMTWSRVTQNDTTVVHHHSSLSSSVLLRFVHFCLCLSVCLSLSLCLSVSLSVCLRVSAWLFLGTTVFHWTQNFERSDGICQFLRNFRSFRGMLRNSALAGDKGTNILVRFRWLQKINYCMLITIY